MNKYSCFLIANIIGRKLLSQIKICNFLKGYTVIVFKRLLQIRQQTVQWNEAKTGSSQNNRLKFQITLTMQPQFFHISEEVRLDIFQFPFVV